LDNFKTTMVEQHVTHLVSFR